jgi:hypothetical protein
MMEHRVEILIFLLNHTASYSKKTENFIQASSYKAFDSNTLTNLTTKFIGIYTSI